MIMWKDTTAMCELLGIHRATLMRMKLSGRLIERRHWTKKNPDSQRSHLLWHQQRVEMALGRL
jgi:hypothetical protein